MQLSRTHVRLSLVVGLSAATASTRGFTCTEEGEVVRGEVGEQIADTQNLLMCSNNRPIGKIRAAQWVECLPVG